MNPVISPNMRFCQAALRASKIWSPTCTIAASTGVGLFQWVKSQAVQRSRSVVATVFLFAAQGQRRCTLRAKTVFTAHESPIVGAKHGASL